MNKIKPRIGTSGTSEFKMQKESSLKFCRTQKHKKGTKPLKKFIYSSHLIQVIRRIYGFVYPAVIKYIFMKSG